MSDDSWWNVPHWKYTPWGYVTFNKPQDRTQYYVQSFVGGILPPVGAYHHARDTISYMDDYLKNKDMDYNDIKYPSLTPGYSGVSSLGRAMRSVSRNVESLYESEKRSRRISDSRLRSAFNDGRNWEMAYRWRQYAR